ELSVIDNVLVALRRGRLGFRDLLTPDRDPEQTDLARSLLAFVGYAGPLDCPAAALAHVDRRLVEIARALAIAPKVLAVDEPAPGLDPGDPHKLGELLQRIAAAGIAVLLVVHDMKLVMAVSDHVVVLDAGKKIAEGPPTDIQRDPVVLEAYLGAQLNIARDRKTLRPTGTTILATKQLNAGYGGPDVIRGIDIAIEKGELVAVLGANGAGKSTLMSALVGINRPIGGSVLLRHRHIEVLSTSRIVAEGLVLVPEGRQVFPELSVIDNIRLGAYRRAVAGPDVHRRRRRAKVSPPQFRPHPHGRLLFRRRQQALGHH